MRLHFYNDKECLFLEGDLGTYYYILFKGTVSIYVNLPATSKAAVLNSRSQAMKSIPLDPASFLGQFLYSLHEGDGFGEVAMFSADARRTASCLACGPCEIIQIAKEVLKIDFDRTIIIILIFIMFILPNDS